MFEDVTPWPRRAGPGRGSVRRAGWEGHSRASCGAAGAAAASRVPLPWEAFRQSSHCADELAGVRGGSWEAPEPRGCPSACCVTGPACASAHPTCSLDPPSPLALGLASLRRRSPPIWPPPTELAPPPGSAWYPECKHGRPQAPKAVCRLQGPAPAMPRRGPRASCCRRRASLQVRAGSTRPWADARPSPSPLAQDTAIRLGSGQRA